VFGDDAWLAEDAQLGDEALAVTATFTTEGDASELARVYVRVGAEGLMITLRGLNPPLPPGLPLLTVVEELAEAQLRCLEAVSCLEPLPVPERLAT
jgi:hypothetical protein